MSLYPPDATRPNPYVFVVGCPRSGTTLLQRMLDNHPWLAVANDTHFIPRAVKKMTVTADMPLTDDLAERVRTYRRFPRLGLSADQVAAAQASATTYAEFVTALYDTYARLHGKPLAGEKTPDYCRSVPLLHTLFPTTRFVHIIRDGRDVALSTLEWANGGKGPGTWSLWDTEPVAACALWWRWQVEQGCTEGARLGASHYHEVAYENLVAEPEASLRQIAQFLDLPYEEAMVAFYVGKTRHNPRLSAKSAWLPATQGLRDWRTQMAPRDVALFEAIAGSTLEARGYPQQHARIPADVQAVADRCEAWWALPGNKATRPLPSMLAAV